MSGRARLIETDKTFFGPDGAPAARIREHLERVDEATYENERVELLGPSR
jgi:hypothetical protein